MIEPAWDRFAHLPANLGALQALRFAYPDASITFAGGAMQIDEMSNWGDPFSLSAIQFLVEPPFPDSDTLYPDYKKRREMLERVLNRMGGAPDLVVLGSCTSSTLAAIAILGLAPKCVAFLHGNANELGGWRSNHPIRRHFDLTSSMKRFVRKRGRVLVYERRIRDALSTAHPWLKSALRVVPHPILDREAGSRHEASNSEGKTLLKVGFAGLATSAKGFPEFSELARACRAAGMSCEFYSIGPLHPECKGVDQSALVQHAGLVLGREEFLGLLGRMDFLFAWHKDVFYATAASGIVYDAINLKIPIVGRSGGLLAQLDLGEASIGKTFDNISDVVDYLGDPERIQADKARFASHLSEVRERHTVAVVGAALKSAFQLPCEVSRRWGW